MLQAEEMDKDLSDPMFNQNTNCFKKHLKTILFVIGALIIITAVVIILIVVLKDDDDDKGKDNDDKEEEEPKEEEKEEEQKEEEKEEEEEVEKPYDYGLDLDELKRRTNPENLNYICSFKANF